MRLFATLSIIAGTRPAYHSGFHGGCSPVEARQLVQEHVAVVMDHVPRLRGFDAGPVAGDRPAAVVVALGNPAARVLARHLVEPWIAWRQVDNPIDRAVTRERVAERFQRLDVARELRLGASRRRIGLLRLLRLRAINGEKNLAACG